MRRADELRVGDTIKSALLDEKKGTARIVLKVTPRTQLTKIETVQKANSTHRELFELRSDLEVVV